MDIYLLDVLDQPDAISKGMGIYFSASYIGNVRKVLRSFDMGRTSNIFFTGMGSSYYSVYGAAMYLNSEGIRAFIRPAGEFLYYGINAVKSDDIVIVVSQSGKSAEIVKLVDKLKSKNFKNILVITNDENSPAFETAKERLSMHMEPETFVATRTYLASVIINLIIAYVISGGRLETLKAEIATAIEAMYKYLEFHELKALELEKFRGEVNHIEFWVGAPNMALRS